MSIPKYKDFSSIVNDKHSAWTQFPTNAVLISQRVFAKALVSVAIKALGWRLLLIPFFLFVMPG